MDQRLGSGLVIVGLVLVGCAGEDERRPVPAERIFVGNVLTMNDAQPRAEAVAVRDGRVLAVGRRAEVLERRDEQTVVTYLASACVVPGFVDAHGHVSQTALKGAAVPLDPPPLGGVASIADLVVTLQAGLARRELAEGEWLVGWGYDDALLAEQRHPTRHDLDRVAADRPILVVHRSGHVVSLNTLGLARAGVTRASRNPPGGRIDRDPAGGPTGVLEAAATARGLAPLRELRADPARLDAALREALAVYASRGVTTCQEAHAAPEVVEALRAAAARAPLPVDVAVFVTPRGTAAERLLGAEDPAWGTYLGGVRLAGVSLVLDGSLLGRTAWLSAPYVRLPANPLELAACDDPLTGAGAALPPTHVGALYAGYPALRRGQLEAQLRRLLGQGWEVMAHCQGDAAADQLLDALERVREDEGGRAGRVALIHGLTLRDDQLERMARLGVTPSFFVGQLHYWGERHRDLLGPERAARLAPVASALARGLPFTLHEDAPTTPPGPLLSVACAVQRRTAAGAVLGPEQRVSALDALRGVTVHAARLLGEEEQKGTIQVGKLADLVILSADPTEVAAEALGEIEVLQTIKRGQTVYRRGGQR